MRRFLTAYLFLITGVVIIVTYLRTVSYNGGHPNGLLAVLVLWACTGGVWLLFYQPGRGIADATEAANKVHAELVRVGFTPEDEIEGWVVFYDWNMEHTFRMQLDFDRGRVRVQRGRLLDPWRFEPDASWWVKPGEMPGSLLEAIG